MNIGTSNSMVMLPSCDAGTLIIFSLKGKTSDGDRLSVIIGCIVKIIFLTFALGFLQRTTNFDIKNDWSNING